MANAITVQKLVDGPRNVVLKIDGYVDTADIAASQSLTGGATTTGSTTITYTSNTAVLAGQFISGTGIPAGAYIVSITSATAAVISAAATATNSGLTFTAAAGAIVIADPVLFSPIDNYGPLSASALRIDRIIYTVDEGLAVTLLWDATTQVRIVDLVKAGHQELHNFGGYVNNAGTGKTGRILLSTEGWASTKIYEFTVTLELVKQ